MSDAGGSAADLAQRLLDAHVRFQLEELRGEGLTSLIEQEVDHALAAASRLHLDDVVDRADVVAVAIKYIASFRLPGAIPELAGDVAVRVRTHPANDTTLGEVIGRRHIAAFIAKLAEMQPVRARIAELLAENESVRQWLAEFLHSLTTSAVESNRRLAERIPGVASALSVGDRLAGRATREADRAARDMADRAARGILSRWQASMAAPIDDDTVAVGVEVWDDVARRQMSEVLAAVAEDDLVDLLVIGYELWLDLRESPYLHALVELGVDYFFDTYGGFALDALLAEFGIGRDDLVEEGLRFAPRAVAALDGSGDLEALVRRRLAAFYESDAARELLS